jgi:hypothetical protein
MAKKGDDVKIGIDITASGQDVAKDIIAQIKLLRKELRELEKAANTPEGRAARQKQLDDERADARALSEQRKRQQQERKVQLKVEKQIDKEARDADRSEARRVAEQKKVDDATEKKRQAFLDSIVKDRVAKQKAADRQSADETRASAINIRVSRRDAAAAEKAAAQQIKDQNAASARQLYADRYKRREAAREESRIAADQRKVDQQQTRQEAAAMRAVAAERAKAEDALKRHATATETVQAAYAKLRNEILSLVAAYAGFQTIRAFIELGIDFNRTIETATLGISSLIAAQTKMVDSTGKVVEGMEKLDLSSVFATEQVQKLRVASLQTHGTTVELVGAFQQAVGVGIRWGLTLDQIREVTVGVAQAAGTVGVPMHQLNEEIRSLLAGTISVRNTRLATALGITNPDIRKAQQMGTLYQYITGRLEAFGLAGLKVQRTFSGVMSNLKETLQNFAGDVVAPLFDDIKDSGTNMLEQMFDMKNARISRNFAGILDVGRNVFAQLSDMLANAINSGVGGAKDFSLWLEHNRVQVAQITNAFVQASIELGLIIRDMLELVGLTAKESAEIGLWRWLLADIGLTFALVRQTMSDIMAALQGINVLILGMVQGPFYLLLRVLEKIVGIFNKEWAAAIHKVADETIQMTIDVWKDFNRRANEALHSSDLNEFTNRLRETDKAAREAAIGQGLLEDAVNKATDAETAGILATGKLLKAGRLDQKQYTQVVTGYKLESLRKQIDANEKYLKSLDDTQKGEKRRTQQTISNLKLQEDAILRGIKLEPGVPPPEKNPKDSGQKRLRGIDELAKAQRDKDLAELKGQLDREEIAYKDYYERVEDAQNSAFNQMILGRQQLLRELRSKPTEKQDIGAQDQLEAEIGALFQEKEKAMVEAQEDLRKDLEKLDDEMMKAHIDLLKQQGQFADAAALELTRDFRKKMARLAIEKRPEDSERIKTLFDTANARAELQEMDRRAKVVQQSLDTNLADVQSQLAAGVINENEARAQQVQYYKAAQREIVGMIPAMREFARMTGDQDALDSVQRLETAMRSMGTTIKQLSDDWFQFKTTTKESSTEALSGFFQALPETVTQSYIQVNSLKEQLAGAQAEMNALLSQPATPETQARVSDLRKEIQETTVALDQAQDEIITWRTLFIDAIRSIAASLQKLVSDMLAAMIIQRTMGLIGNVAAGLSGGVSPTLSGGITGGGTQVVAAGGGYVRGPGTSTSDSIPGWLSNGEYVIRAAAVKEVGLSTLEDINRRGRRSVRGRRRALGYADGGFVSSGGAARGGFDATIGLEPGLVSKHILTREGTDAVVTALSSRRKSIQQILGST